MGICIGEVPGPQVPAPGGHGFILKVGSSYLKFEDQVSLHGRAGAVNRNLALAVGAYGPGGSIIECA